MEKKIRLGIVGSKTRISLIREVVPEAFPEIQTEIYEDDRYVYCDDMEQDLLALRQRVDGVVFCGELQFKLYQHLFEPHIPCSCIQKDSICMLNAFLALASRKIDVSRISVDNCTPSAVRKILWDAGITENHIHILRRQNLSFAGDDYYEALYRTHRRLYREGAVDGCITTLFFVYDRLSAEGIPVTYARPTTDNITNTVSRTKQECLERRNMTEGNLAVLVIRLTARDDSDYRSHSEYGESHEKLKAAEEIYFFAENARATVIQQSDEQFTLIINRSDLMNYSNALESLPFLQLLRDNCKCDVSLGIGFGYSPGEARANASRALKKAIRHEGSCTYIVHNVNSISGPVNFLSEHREAVSETQEILQILSERTGIPASKLYRISLLREREKKSLFTAAELASHLNMSVRSASRLLITMEENGLASLTGQTASGKAGRPGNIYRISFDLD